MGGFFNMDNPVFNFLGKLVDIFMLSVFWLVCCIPVFTIGASTAAMYYTANKVLKRGRGYIASEFFRSFKQNFKQGAILSVIFVVLALFFSWDAYLMKENYANGMSLGKIYPIFYAFMILEAALVIYVFPYLARFENDTKSVIRNSGIIAIAHLPKTLLCLLIMIFAGLMIYIVPITICIVPAAVTLLLNRILEKIFYIYMTDEQKQIEDEINMDI